MATETASVDTDRVPVETGETDLGDLDPNEVLPLPDMASPEADAPVDADPHDLLRRGLALEDAAGRVRHGTVAPRPLDVDLIAAGDRVVVSDDLVLPHPRAHLRGFVLVPWAEADPSAELPGYGPVSRLAEQVGRAGLTARPDLSAVS